jgi:hypothetical protein
VSEKTLKRLLGALVVVLVLYGGVWVVSRWSGGGPAAAPALADIFDGIAPSVVTEVTLKGPTDSVTLARTDTTGLEWTVNGMATDSGTVARFFSTLKDTKVGDLVSTNPANQAAMGISADSAWTLSFDVAGEKRTLLVGHSGPRYNTTYVRLPGKDQVYLAEGELRSNVTRSLDDWRNKRIVAVDTAAVHRLEVQRDGEAYTLVRADSSWTLAGGEATNKTSVKDILTELSGLQAAGFLARGDTLSETPEGAHLLALSASGDTLGQVTIGSGAADRWARTPGDSVTYRLAGWRVDRVVPKRESVVEVKKGS